MDVNFVKAKNIVVKSSIPTVDYVINPYVGCQHGCKYCYAEFMKRFTNHAGDTWGEFLDIKQYDWSKIKPERYNNNTILLSSVTDPYLPLEMKYENTRSILEHLVDTKAEIWILTKSKLLTRDIDLFRRFENIKIGISINTLDDEFARLVEPRASKPSERIAALKEVNDKNIPTYCFISPIFPRITDYQAIIDATKSITRDYRFENLNFRPNNIQRILNIIKSSYPNLIEFYKELRNDVFYWNGLGQKIMSCCSEKNLRCKIEFHHGGFSKT